MDSFRSYLSRITSKKSVDTSAPIEPSSQDVVAEVSLRSQKYDVRLADFERCLIGPLIPLHVCRMLCFGGIPDTKGLRSVCWKILLGYLPTKKDLWPEVLEKRRMEYDKLAASFLINPFENSNESFKANGHLKEIHINPCPESSNADPSTKLIDNPLLLSGEKPQESAWRKFFDNNLLHDEITKDVRRTHSGMHFFTQKLDCTEKYTESVEKNAYLLNVKSEAETHQDVMSRILFLFAKLNPGVRYVQGMNELLAPLYYVFAQDPDDAFRFYAEPDAFYCFTGMMAELKDRFIASLDSSDLGIASCIEEFRDLLRRADPELYLHLERQYVDARYYSLRWFTLLCSQEFRLPDVLRLWDSLFADPYRFEFLRYCCCSMLICIRSQLLSMDYAAILQTLQSYPDTDLKDILDGAEDVMFRLTGRQLHFVNDVNEYNLVD